MTLAHNFFGACPHCGAIFSCYSPPCRPRKFCSARCGSMALLGTKQSASHINARKRFAQDHGNWVGDNATVKSGRSRALRAFIAPQNCQSCGAKGRIDRHHCDGNTLNNSAENIQFLCRLCHMIVDGRMENLQEARHGR